MRLLPYNLNDTHNYKTFTLIILVVDIMGMVINYGQMEKRSNRAEKLDVLLSNDRFVFVFNI